MNTFFENNNNYPIPLYDIAKLWRIFVVIIILIIFV